MGAGLLPTAIHNNKLYFLFGKENPLEDSAKGWSDFGGSVENGETPYKTALREGGEELTGFLGDGNELLKMIRKNGGVYKLKHNTYHIHMFFIDYDENLPKYYNNNHHFLWNRMDHTVLNNTRLFEKIEIDWFSVDDIKNRRGEFRNFYQNIVDMFLADIDRIHKFADRKYKSKLLRFASTDHSKSQKNITRKNRT